MTKNQDKNLNIFFKWLSVAENCLRPESAPVSEGFSRENFFVFFFVFFEDTVNFWCIKCLSWLKKGVSADECRCNI